MLTKEDLEFYNSITEDNLTNKVICFIANSNIDLTEENLSEFISDLGIDKEFIDPSHKLRLKLLLNIKKAKQYYEEKRGSLRDAAYIYNLPYTTLGGYLHISRTKIRSKSEAAITTCFPNKRNGNINYSSWYENWFADRLNEHNIKYVRQFYIESIHRFADFYISDLNCIIELDGTTHKLRNPEYTNLRNNQYISLGFNLVILNSNNLVKFGEDYASHIINNLSKFYYPFDIENYENQYYKTVWKPASINKAHSPGGIWYNKLDEHPKFDHSLSYENIMEFISSFPERSLTIDDLLNKFNCNEHKIQARVRLSAPDEFKEFDRWHVFYLRIRHPLMKHKKLMLEYKSKGESFDILTLEEVKEKLYSLNRKIKYSDICSLFNVCTRSSNKVKYGFPVLFGIQPSELINQINENYKNN